MPCAVSLRGNHGEGLALPARPFAVARLSVIPLVLQTAVALCFHAELRLLTHGIGAVGRLDSDFQLGSHGDGCGNGIGFCPSGIGGAAIDLHAVERHFRLEIDDRGGVSFPDHP